MLRRQDIFGINIMQPEVFDNLGDDVGIGQSVNLQPMCICRMTKLLERNLPGRNNLLFDCLLIIGNQVDRCLQYLFAYIFIMFSQPSVGTPALLSGS